MAESHHVRELLRRAVAADRLASASRDELVKATWKRIALGYRGLAKISRNMEAE